MRSAWLFCALLGAIAAAATPAMAQPLASDVSVVRGDGGLGLTVYGATFLGSGATTSVMVGVEVTGLAKAALPASGLARQLEIRLLADAESDRPLERLVTTSLPDGETALRAAQEGIRVLARIALSPGRHALTIVARDNGDGSTASLVHAFDVPSLVEEAVTMSHLVLTSSTVGGVTRAEMEEDGSLPILARPVTGRRSFSRGERVEVGAEIYEVPNASPDADFDELSVSTALLTPDGRVVFESTDVGASETLDSGLNGYRHYALLPLDTLSPGSYVVRISALLNGLLAASRSVPITVAGPT